MNAIVKDVMSTTVSDRIVTFEGSPQTASVGHDIVGEVRHVEGVAAVRDRLDYPPDQHRYADRII